MATKTNHTATKKRDAIALLKADHDKVRGLLLKLEKSTERAAKKRTSLLSDIKREITIHAQIEEEIFYPAFKAAVEKKKDRKLFFEALEEHHVVKTVLPEIEATDPASEQFGAKAKVLKELIEHHVGEEEDEMFPRARKAMGRDQILDLGERMEARKAELTDQDFA